LALFLFQNLGRLLSRQYLQGQLWGTQMADAITRTLDTHISPIRSKLNLRPENGFHLVSVYGYGYRLEVTWEITINSVLKSAVLYRRS